MIKPRITPRTRKIITKKIKPQMTQRKYKIIKNSLHFSSHAAVQLINFISIFYLIFYLCN